MEVYEIDEQENRKSSGFDALGTSMMTSTDDQRGIWDIDVKAPQQNLLSEMNDGSIFYNDQFPQILDFPCISSSSSSSSNPAPAKQTLSSASLASAASLDSSSTSSAQSWAVLKSEYTTEEEGDGDREDRLGELRINRKKRSFMGEESEKVPLMSTTAAVETIDGNGTIDHIDVMENFGYMNDIWDPPVDMQQELGIMNDSEVVQESDQEGGEGKLDELGTMFFDWLKSNKEFISAEDMKNIKLKKSTVECASKRLGSSKEGKKQLLKLILEWVQQHQLRRKNSGCGELLTTPAPATTTTPTQYPNLSHFSTPPPPPFNCSSWVPPSDINQGLVSPSTFIPPVGPYSQYFCNADIPSNGMAMVAPPPASTFSFMGGDHYGSGLNGNISSPYGNPGSGEYQVLESAPSWNPSQVTMASSPYNNNNNQFLDVGGNTFAPQIMPLVSGYPDHQFPYNPTVYAAGDEQNVMRLGSSATKEARKKRMARQRRTYFQHHHHSRQNQHNHHHNHVTNSDHQTHAMLIDENCSGKTHGGNWPMYWPSPHSTTTVVPPPPPMDTPQPQSSRPPHSGDQRQFKPASSDKRQGLKTEKNLKFLLQKVLRRRDVGRILLPKKEAESHLPDLGSRDGISIAMKDIGTSQVWNMRYSFRFWPNNKGRMYLLENTGDFVKANGLQEGDFILLYSDVKSGKYLISGVKVRQPATGKSESKKPVERSYRGTSKSARSSPSSPAKVTGF